MGGLDRINGVFNHEGMRKLWLRIRIPIGALVLCGLIPLVKREWFWLGLPVSLAGEFIQLWCFAALHKGKELACKGPYAFVRNPMYLGRYFIVLGFVLLLGEIGLWLLVPYTAFYWFYMFNRVGREEAFLKKALGEPYADYCRRVNRFLPTCKGVSAQSVCYWNWALLTKNHGWINAAALVGVYVVLYFVAGLLH